MFLYLYRNYEYPFSKEFGPNFNYIYQMYFCYRTLYFKGTFYNEDDQLKTFHNLELAFFAFTNNHI